MPGRKSYYAGASNYLARAKERLDEPSHESLFYAAYEVRCAVEARQDQYLRAQQKYAASLPKAWRIGQQGAELERIFASSRIQQITWMWPDGASLSVCHVPVDEILRQRTTNLNDLLHAQLRRRKSSDKWWLEARRRVVDVYRRCWICCQGGLLSPVFHERVGDRVQGNAIMELNEADAELFSARAIKGSSFRLRAEYLDEPPATWVSDIEEHILASARQPSNGTVDQ